MYVLWQIMKLFHILFLKSMSKNIAFGGNYRHENIVGQGPRSSISKMANFGQSSDKALACLIDLTPKHNHHHKMHYVCAWNTMGSCFLLMLVVATMSQLGHTLDNQLILPYICPKKWYPFLVPIRQKCLFSCAKNGTLSARIKKKRDHLFVPKLLNRHWFYL